MVDYIADYLENIRDRRVFPDVQPGYMSRLMPDHAPVEGEEWTAIFNDIERVIMPGSNHSNSLIIKDSHLIFEYISSYSLAKSTYACIFPSIKFISITIRRHVSRCYKLFGIHLGNILKYLNDSLN